MVAAAATCSFLPVAPLPHDTSSKPSLTNIGTSKLATTGKKNKGLEVKTNAQTPPRINGKSTAGLSSSKERVKVEEEMYYSGMHSPRTFINQMPDWSMLLAAITTILLAAEKQWMLLDAKTKRPDALTDRFGTGRMVKDGTAFRQNFSIRSYEIGADRTASIETLMNHLQETALNHAKTSGLFGGGFGSTVEMYKRNLIWVVTKMQVLVDRYPTWGDATQVDSWTSSSGKNGLRRDWLVSDCNTGEILTRASSVCVMMNKVTRRLSKMPDEVRAEIRSHIEELPLLIAEDGGKLPKLDDNTAEYIKTGLTPKWSDLDVNQHVNNVKYIGWILESVPLSILETRQLSSMTLEYRRECGRDSVVESLTSILGAKVDGLMDSGDVECQHLLRLDDGAEVVRGKTVWRPKLAKNLGNFGIVPGENV